MSATDEQRGSHTPARKARFGIELGAVRLPGGDGGGSEGGEAPQGLWALVNVTCGQNVDAAFWYPDPASAPAPLHSKSVRPGGDLDCYAESKAFPLRGDALTRLCNCDVEVSIFAGEEAGNVEAAQPFAICRVPLHHLTRNDELVQLVQPAHAPSDSDKEIMRSHGAQPGDAGGKGSKGGKGGKGGAVAADAAFDPATTEANPVACTVEVFITPSPALQSFAAAGRAMRAVSACIAPCPVPFRAPIEDAVPEEERTAEKLAAAAGGDESQSFSAAVQLPLGGDAVWSVGLRGGGLAYRPPAGAAGGDSAGEDGAEGKEEKEFTEGKEGGEEEEPASEADPLKASSAVNGWLIDFPQSAVGVAASAEAEAGEEGAGTDLDAPLPAGGPWRFLLPEEAEALIERARAGPADLPAPPSAAAGEEGKEEGGSGSPPLAELGIPGFVEVRRSKKEQGKKETVEVEDVAGGGEAALDLRPLCAPDTTVSRVEGVLRRTSRPIPEAADGGGGGGGKGKKGKGKDEPEEEVAPAGPPPDVYAECGARVVVVLRCAQPLVLPPLKPPQPTMRTTDVVPPRAAPPKLEVHRSATDKFRSEVADVIRVVTDEYLHSVGAEVGGGEEATSEERRRRVLYALNSDGRYYEFKERLKRAVVHVVRERFRKRPVPAGADTAQQGLSAKHTDALVGELYTFLVAESNVALNEAVAAARGVKPLPRSQPAGGAGAEGSAALARLKALADEAELNGRVEAAAAHHQERAAKAREAADAGGGGGGDPEPWFDYGMFRLRQGDAGAAAQCLREALATNASHQPSRYAYGALLLARGDFDRADAVLNDALEAAETATERLRASSLLAFSSRVKGADEGAARLALREAFAHLRSVEAEEERSRQEAAEGAGFSRLPRAPRPEDEEEEEAGEGKEEGEDTVGEEAHTASSLAPKRRTVGRLVRAATRRRDEARVLHAAADFLVGASLKDLAARALSLAAEATGEATAAAVDGSDALPPAQALLEGRLALTGEDLPAAEAKLQEAVRLAPKRPSAWAAAGAAASRRGDADTAIDRLRRAVALFEAEAGPDGPPCDLLLRLAALYAGCGETGAAKELYLRACAREPSATAWLGVGRACLQLGEMEEAEEALCEANALDSMNPDVWCALTVFALRCEPPRMLEADQAMAQAVKLDASDAGLLRDMGSLYAAVGKFGDAERLLRRSLVCGEATQTRLALARALHRQHAYESALGEYRAVLAGTGGGEEGAAARSAAEEILRVLGRDSEIPALPSPAEE